MKFNMSTAARRQKWQHYPIPPTPRILQLPGRPRRRPPRAARPVAGESRSRDRTGKLEALFDQERKFLRGGASVPIVLLEHHDERRDRIEDGGGSECEEEDGGGGDRGSCGEAAVEEERWRFQAEVLRAECNLLRMEKEIAVKKLDRTRINIERSLKCAIHTLINGKKKVSEGESSRAVFDREIEHLVGKLKEMRKSLKAGDFRARHCSNFDEQVTGLQRRLKKLGGTSSSKDKRANEIRKIAEASLSIDDENEIPGRDHGGDDHKVDILTRKMEKLSKDMLLETMEEEYGSIPSAANRSVASSASISKRIEWPSSAAASICQPKQEMVSRIDGACSGHCKSVVRRIIEQVRAETEQWSQMQEMLAQVRSEMEELQASRDFWEDQALKSDAQTQSLCSAVQEWRQRALSSEAEANGLRARASAPQEEIRRSRKERDKVRHLLQGETEKRVLICRLKENHRDRHIECKQDEASGDRRRKVHASAGRLAAAAAPERSPFRDIGNSSPMSSRQSSK